MMWRWLLVLGVVVGTPVLAQDLPPRADPVESLPGAGRSVAREVFAARRAALLAHTGPGVVIVSAGSRADIEADVRQDNDFRQDDDFFYLTGIETPDAWLVLVSDGNAGESILLLPAANPMMQRWTGSQLAPGPDAAALTGIADVRAFDRDSLANLLVARLAGGRLYTLVGSHRAAPFVATVEEQGWATVDLRPVLDSLRLVKDDAGIAALRAAAAVTAAGVTEGMRAVRPGMFEYQLEAVVEYTFRDLGADRLGFPSIVGSGPNSTVLHYDANRRRMESGDLVVVDVGAEYAYHTADVTRTFPVSGRFTDRQRALYDLVLATQRAVIDGVRPGATLADLNGIARRYLAEHGGDLCGLPDEQGCAPFMIHGVTHWLGMRVHDVGDFRTPLAPGMVLTVEPGLYLPDEGVGIRIEDDVLVTDEGADVLTAGAVKTADDIETLMARAAGRADTRE